MTAPAAHEAHVLHAAGRTGEAVAVLGKHLAANPDDVPALTDIVLMLSESGNAKEGRRNAERAVRLAPEDPAAWQALAWCMMRSSLHENAFDAAGRAVELAPGSWVAHEVLAQVAGANYRRAAEALVAADRAVRLAPGEPSPHVVLGNIWLARGRYALANQQYRAALRLDPQDLFARQSLVRSQVDSGQPGAIGDVAELVAGRPATRYPVYVLKLAVGDVINRIQGVYTVGGLLLLTALLGVVIGAPESLDQPVARILLAAPVIGMAVVALLVLRASRRSLGARFQPVLAFIRSQDRLAVAWGIIVAMGLAAGVLAPLLPETAMLAGYGALVWAGIGGWLVQTVRALAIRP